MYMVDAVHYKKIVIKDGETGLCIFDNRYEKETGHRNLLLLELRKEVTCKIFNMKIQQLDISGQKSLPQIRWRCG